jgi:hypothetical protein
MPNGGHRTPPPGPHETRPRRRRDENQLENDRERPQRRQNQAVRLINPVQRERERERERCVSDADASSYGTITARNGPQHICPQRTHANTTPHHAVRPLSHYIPCYAFVIDPADQPKPNLSITWQPTTGNQCVFNLPPLLTRCQAPSAQVPCNAEPCLCPNRDLQRGRR